MNNYYKFQGYAKECIASGKYQDAEIILIRIIEINEDNSILSGEGVAPAYYLELAKLYKKMKEHEKDEIVLHGFLVQIKARGQTPKKTLESYLKLKKDQDPEIVKKNI